MGSKKCSRCKRKKKLKHFNFKNKRTGRRQALCRKCQNADAREHYKNNTASYKARAVARKKRNRQVLKEYLLAHPCVDCGFTDIRVLDFDHQHSKKFNVCEQAHNGVAVATLRKEIAKCEIRCRNCHGIRHEVERPGWRSGVI